MKKFATRAVGLLAGTTLTLGLSSVSASAAPICDVKVNEWAYCYSAYGAPQYRYSVKCHDDGVINRFVWVHGPWRNKAGTHKSRATCAPGDIYHSSQIQPKYN